MYANGFVITHEAIKDNLYEQIGTKRTGNLAFSLLQTKENVVANIYNRAFNSSYVGGDGKTLIATDHPTLAGTASNKLTTDADMSEASLEDLSIQLMNATNSRGMKIALMSKTLIVPPALAFEATRILKSTGQNDSANNAVNALRSMGYYTDVVVNPYLTDADAYFIRTNAPEGHEAVPARGAAVRTGRRLRHLQHQIQGTGFEFRFPAGFINGVMASPSCSRIQVRFFGCRTTRRAYFRASPVALTALAATSIARSRRSTTPRWTG
jgi:hypothetical protein